MSAYGDETERSRAMLFLSTLNAVTDVGSLCGCHVSDRTRDAVFRECLRKKKEGQQVCFSKIFNHHSIFFDRGKPDCLCLELRMNITLEHHLVLKLCNKDKLDLST